MAFSLVKNKQKIIKNKDNVLVDKNACECYNIIVASRGNKKRQITTKTLKKLQKGIDKDEKL